MLDYALPAGDLEVVVTTEQLEALCEAAKKRIADFVARSAGQHVRAMRKSWSKS